MYLFKCTPSDIHKYEVSTPNPKAQTCTLCSDIRAQWPSTLFHHFMYSCGHVSKSSHSDINAPTSPTVLPSLLISHFNPDTTASISSCVFFESAFNIPMIISPVFHSNEHYSQPNGNTRSLAGWSHFPAKLWCPAATEPVYSSLQPYCTTLVVLLRSPTLAFTIFIYKKHVNPFREISIQYIAWLHSYTHDMDLPTHRQLVCRHAQSFCYILHLRSHMIFGRCTPAGDLHDKHQLVMGLMAYLIWFQTLISKPYKHTLHIMLTSSNGLLGM